MDRTALGQKHFSTPLMEVCESLKKTIEKQEWADFNPDPIVHYYQSMIAGSLPEMVEQTLDEESIEDMDPSHVKIFGSLLMRDMFRRNHTLLRPNAKDGRWVESLFNAVAKQHSLPPEAFKDSGAPYDLEKPDAQWAASMGGLMGLPAAGLVHSQSVAMDLIDQECDVAELVGDEDEAEVIPSEHEFEEDEEYARGGFFSGAPPWMISSLVHGLILLVLALVALDPVSVVKNVLTVTPSEEGDDMEEFALDQVEPDSMEEEMVEEPVVPPPSMLATADIQIETPEAEFMIAEVTTDIVDAIAPVEAMTQSLSTAMSNATEFSARSTDMKKEMLKKYGGSEATEAAVAKALKWFSNHQLPSGAWALQHNVACRGRCDHPGEGEPGHKGFMGATSLAILPFLGAGQTHMQGKYKSLVHRGLMYLASNMKVKQQGGVIVGDCRGKGGNLYDHAMATIVLCEAYAMTHDEALAQPAQAALNFIVTAQNKTGGGWRYTPGQAGDTSVVGWMVMALKSGHMGHLAVPPNTVRGASLFLDRVQADGGVYYGYDKPSKKASTTAVGLLCRMYLGWKKDRSQLQQGVSFLGKTGLKKTDAYHNYYAAQVLRQIGGPEWDKFNEEMSTWLVDTQVADGHAAGSWYFKSGHTGKVAGRLGITSLCTMTLEVYYRHLPLYAEAAAEDDFPL